MSPFFRGLLIALCNTVSALVLASEHHLTNALSRDDDAAFDAILSKIQLCDQKVRLVTSDNFSFVRVVGENRLCQTDEELKGSIVSGYFLAERVRAEMCDEILGDGTTLDRHNKMRRKFSKELASALTNAQSLYSSTYGENWRKRWNADMAALMAGVRTRERASVNAKSCENLKVGYELILTSGTWDEFDKAIFNSQFARTRPQIPPVFPIRRGV